MQLACYDKMILRRRFCKRFCLVSITFFVSFYCSTLLFGDLKIPSIMRLTQLHTCPACYGVSVCPELYSNQILLDVKPTWTEIFNTKSIYYGYTKSNRRVILKKLAHTSEFEEFDASLCNTWKLSANCSPSNLLGVTNIDNEIINAVSMPHKTTDMKLIMCPNAFSIFKFLEPLHSPKGNFKAEEINIWTMLIINPEPIMLQILKKSNGWPVPAFGGVCGRLELLAYEGEPLSNLHGVTWHRKLKFAKQILDAAMDFTYKHTRYRFYLLDWSLDNIVANEKDEITIVDLEDIVILDKHATPKRNDKDWYSTEIHGNETGFTFSVQEMCRHHISDHNLWAACYLLAGNEDPLLKPIPELVRISYPRFEQVLDDCLYLGDKVNSVNVLQNMMMKMLVDGDIVEYGVR